MSSPAPDSPEASSADSSTSEPFSFVGDVGPGFDPEGAAADSERIRAEAEAELREPGLSSFVVPDVPEESIRSFVHNAGDMAHALVGVGDADWVVSAADEDRICPALTRIINRYEPTKMLAAKSDEAAVIVGLGLYSWRSMLERQAALAGIADTTAPGPLPTAVPSSPAPAPSVARPDVVEGYSTLADRMTQAKEHTPDAQPRQDP